MDADERTTASLCKKMYELPSVFTDWQQSVWCPDCDYYNGGRCSNPVRGDGNAACPFDGQLLPLREVTVETPHDRPRSTLDVGPCGEHSGSEQIAQG
jgi:hypothetical protein